MTPQFYRTMVGAFVIGAIALFTLGVILLGGGRLFSNDVEYILYFDGSVSGLSIGAPVVFRGVPMGSVTKISLVANARDSNVTIPVTIRIDENSFIRNSGRALSEADQQEIIRKMVERGLRARLQLQSLITGQYRVELNFFPDTPMNFRSSTPDMEIPTVPSPIDTLQRTLARIPIDQLAGSLSLILENVSEAVDNGKLKAAIEAFTATFRETQALLADSPLRHSLESTLSQVEGASRAMQKELPGALAAFRSAMQNLAEASERFRRVASSAENTLGRDSPTMNDMRRLLKEAIAAARSLHNLAEMLERNPEALLMGRQGKR